MNPCSFFTGPRDQPDQGIRSGPLWYREPNLTAQRKDLVRTQYDLRSQFCPGGINMAAGPRNIPRSIGADLHVKGFEQTALLAAQGLLKPVPEFPAQTRWRT